MRRPLLAALAALPLLAACTTAAPSPSTGPRVVFFGDSSFALDANARAVVAEAAAYSASNPGAPVVVTGYADPLGPNATNQALSTNRARSVAQALQENGVPPNRITTVGRGETPPPGTQPYPSRRAEIRVGL